MFAPLCNSFFLCHNLGQISAEKIYNKEFYNIIDPSVSHYTMINIRIEVEVDD